MKIPSVDEVKACFGRLHPLKSPRTDGFPGCFYINYWNTVEDRVTRFVQECFRLRAMPKSVNRTFIVLIPKTKQPSCFNHSRPISLSNFVYKIVSKIITDRLKGLMGKTISKHQGAFLEGRWIADNTVAAHEVVHKVKRHRGKNGLMMLKMDMKKAYDRMEWCFVRIALGAWGFSEKVQKLIGSCISSVQYSLLLNGGVASSFTPSRGLKQGDHLSPFLFILCSKFLSRIISRKEEK